MRCNLAIHTVCDGNSIPVYCDDEYSGYSRGLKWNTQKIMTIEIQQLLSHILVKTSFVNLENKSDVGVISNSISTIGSVSIWTLYFPAECFKPPN